MQTFLHDIRNGVLIDRTITSLRTLAIGYAFGLALAAVFTTLAVASGVGTRILSTLTAMFNPLPAIALLPLALIWFGLGTPSLVFVIIHSVLWAVALNTLIGFRSVPETLRMSGRNVGLKGARYVGLILIPAAFPSILAGLKIGWAFAWRTLVAAELVFGVSSRSGGIGWYIFEARNDLDTPTVFSGLLTVILIGLVRRVGDLPRHRSAHGQSLGHAAMSGVLGVDIWRGTEQGAFQAFAIPRRDAPDRARRGHRDPARARRHPLLSLRLPRRHVRLLRHGGERAAALDLPHARERGGRRRRAAAARAAAQFRGGQGPRGRDDAVLRQMESSARVISSRALRPNRISRWCRRQRKERQLADAGIECIGCGVCYSACDVVAWDEDYLGPAALNRAWTLVNDVRDRGQCRAARRGVRQRRLSGLPHPYELHDVLPEGHRADLCDRRPQTRDGRAQSARRALMPLLFLAQRATAFVLACAVAVHLATILYAVRGGLTAAEILARTHGNHRLRAVLRCCS